MLSLGHCGLSRLLPLSRILFLHLENEGVAQNAQDPHLQPLAVPTSQTHPQTTLMVIKTQSFESFPHISTNSTCHDTSTQQAVNLRPKLLTECWGLILPRTETH